MIGQPFHANYHKSGRKPAHNSHTRWKSEQVLFGFAKCLIDRGNSVARTGTHSLRTGNAQSDFGQVAFQCQPTQTGLGAESIRASETLSRIDSHFDSHRDIIRTISLEPIDKTQTYVKQNNNQRYAVEVSFQNS